MSVLLAYGTLKEAVIMSDSRITYYDNNNNILGFKDNRQKIYKITDNFVIGTAGDARGKNIIENINPDNPKSSFNTLKDYTYEQWLEFFKQRIKIFGIDKIPYITYVSIGIDSNNKIRMDIFNNITCEFEPACPKDNDIFSTIFLPPNASEQIRDDFYNTIKKTQNTEKYCRDTISYISSIDNTVGGEIQYYKVNV